MTVETPFALGLLPSLGKPIRLDSPDGRFYTTPAGTFPSVTTILQATMPAAKRAILARWRDKLGHEEADRVRDAAARRGSRFHALIQQYLLSWPRPEPPTDLYFKAVVPFLARIEKVLLIEGEIWHDKVGYAGSLDLLAVIDGKVTLVDWKTSDKPKPKEYLYDHLPQLAAYSAAVHRLYGVLVEQAIVAKVTPRCPFDPLVVGPREIGAAWQEFRTRAAAFHSAAAQG